LCGQRVWRATREEMTASKQYVLAAALAFAIAASPRGAQGQTSTTTSLPAASEVSTQAPPSAVSAPVTPKSADVSAPALFDFKDTDIKFNLQSLMNTLRDSRHEGWVLAAYPDPNTRRPLIGAGFSLDVLATEHPQTDPLNPHPFLEPSSAQLWQAAGLDSELLQKILARFDHDASAWTTKQYRRKIRMHALTPELTEEEATRLLRISAIQAVYNARAYCRNFDQLTGPQQMALSQLVFQMGVNLEEFVQFLSAINISPNLTPAADPSIRDVSLTRNDASTDPEHWKTVQTTLMDSQWARRYSGRASTVIAMFDPGYSDNPRAAEMRVEAVLHPPAKHRRKQQSAHMVRTASSKGHGGKASSTHSTSTRKRKTT